MLPIVLVLLVATSALAAPSVQITQGSINDIAPQRSNGQLVGSYLANNAFELVDGGDTNVYILTLQSILTDLAGQGDRVSQSLAVGQILAALSQLSTGSPGDACAASSLIEAELSGNPNAIRAALGKFAQALSFGIDQISQLATNPNAARYSVGSQGGCSGGGKTYPFEAAWDRVQSLGGSPGLINESYCASKRLYGAFNTRSNNVGAFVTAISLPSANEMIQRALPQVAQFLNAAANGNPGAAAGAAKQALVRGAY